MTIDEILQSMSDEDRSWVEHLRRTRQPLRISNNGNLCSLSGWAKVPYIVAYNTRGLGDRRARKRAAMTLRDYMRKPDTPSTGFVVYHRLPGVLHSVRIDITLRTAE